MLRSILWLVSALLAALVAVRLAVSLLHGSLGRVLRRGVQPPVRTGPSTGGSHHAAGAPVAVPAWLGPASVALGLALLLAAVALLASRALARRHRRYVRMRVLPYRTDHADADALARMYAAVHAALIERWWRRLLRGQPSAAFEVWLGLGEEGGAPRVWLALACPAGRVAGVEAAMRVAYPNVRLQPEPRDAAPPPVLVRLKKHAGFIRRTATAGRFERDPQPPVDGLMRAMAAGSPPALVQLALTPAPAAVERLAKSLFKHREAALSRRRREHAVTLDRSLLDDAELRGGLEVQHRALFFADIRVLAASRADAERIGGALRARRAENRLVERGSRLRQGRLGLFERRLRRGEGNPVPALSREVFAPSELAELWHSPSVEFAAVPFARGALPPAPAPPEILRPGSGRGTLRDALGRVSIHAELRRQNVAVPGTVDQGKSSFLVASVAEDLRRERCAVIVLDPKGDAAEAALSAVPSGRTCTLLDLADPTCGFNPLRVDAPADAIADYVVAALKNLFSDDGVILQL